MSRLDAWFADDSGSAAAEFVMVSALLTVLTLSVLQLALGLHIRNTLIDAASEGARYAALADSGLSEGAARTRDLISVALGPGYAGGVAASYDDFLGRPAAVVTVIAPMPLFGLVGIDGGLEVAGHAAVEELD